MTNPRCVTS